ncbi:TIM-barrel domain-containing protein [Coleofasciculus sp. G2-EDA-02]|uniref:TIM-barrel domain-containing protein n=1 Tax=Coleofasciculus sp. G2-EDA-02 TaxID=3069529 RepID=UPI0032F0A561
MSNEIFPSHRVYKFLKVEEYFGRYKEWDKLGSAISHSFEATLNTLSLTFKKGDGSDCLMLIQILQNDTLRVRFNPKKSTEGEYSLLDHLLENRNFDETDEELIKNLLFDIDYTEGNGQVVLTTKSEHNPVVMKVVVTLAPFGIKVFNNSTSNANYTEIPVWQTAEPGIYYTPNGPDDYAIIQAVKSPADAKYIGFGEQGGTKLSKNTEQLNYFNFDNMRYRQVYDRGPLDNREPLYHSEPFFYEFNGIPGSKNVNAVLLDNPSQVFLDINYSNSSRYMLGTRFNDLDYYVFIAEDPKDILDSFTAIVGRAELKPRYALGYHQGCYGYECAADLKWAVDKHRDWQIPLDGLAVDVDLQDNYRTFTIKPNYQTNKNSPYEQTFGNHKEMFSYLRSRGVKCSTNITPVISKQDEGNPGYYSTYKEGLDNDYFVKDLRYDANNPDNFHYQIYGGGNEYSPNGGWVEGYNSGKPYIGEVYYGNDAAGNELGSPGHYADFARPEVREWWGKQYTYLFEQGLEFVWQDMTTPAIRDKRGDMKGFPFKLYINSDFQGTVEQTTVLKAWNAYSYNLHRATYEGLNKLPGRENKRNFIIGRGSYVGSHRYAGLWTGDNSSDWDFFQMNISQVLSLGMHALAITGQDIGGFEQSASDDKQKWASPELVIRWTAAGAFLPWFRNHYVRKGRKEFQEVFQYTEWFETWGKEIPAPQDLYYMVPTICRHYIQLRYRLMQLFYDALFENTLDGLPICRPLFLNDPHDLSLYNDKEQFLNDEFFVRKDLLIAPVLHPQSENNNNGKRDVYLPQGSDWYGFVNNSMPLGSVVEGGTTIRDFDANINLNGDHIHFIVPMYVRAGAIIPTIELEQYVGQLNAEGKPNPITLNVYPGQQGEYTMYLDDGVSRSSAPKAEVDDDKANDEYRATKITHSYTSEKTREIKVERIHDGYTPQYEQYFFVALLHDPGEAKGNSGPLKSVTIAGQQVSAITGNSPEERAQHLNASANNAWYYNENINISFIKVFDNASSITLKLDYV